MAFFVSEPWNTTQIGGNVAPKIYRNLINANHTPQRAAWVTYLPNFSNHLLNKTTMKTPLFAFLLRFDLSRSEHLQSSGCAERNSFGMSMMKISTWFISNNWPNKLPSTVLIWISMNLSNGKYYINLSDEKEPMSTKIIIKEQAVLATLILSNQILCLN